MGRRSELNWSEAPPRQPLRLRAKSPRVPSLCPLGLKFLRASSEAGLAGRRTTSAETISPDRPRTVLGPASSRGRRERDYSDGITILPSWLGLRIPRPGGRHFGVGQQTSD